MDMDHGMSTGHGSHGGMSGGGATDNPPAWYDFLLREDLAQYHRLADDGMMSIQRPWNPYPVLRSVKDTRLPANAPRRVFRLTLDGDMGEYVWSYEVRSPI